MFSFNIKLKPARQSRWNGPIFVTVNSMYYRCYVLPSLKDQNRFRFSLKESVAVLQ